MIGFQFVVISAGGNCTEILRDSLLLDQACTNNVCPHEITEALNTFLLNYDNIMRPNNPDEDTLTIYSDIHITGIGPVSEQDMDYTLDVFFRQRWNDPRLKLDSVNENITELSLSNKMVDRIWTPDTYFYNGEPNSIAHKTTVPNSLLRIYSDGSILYTLRLTIKAKCMMSLIDFPMDVHKCNLVYGSFGYTNDNIRYEWYNQSGKNKGVNIDESSRRLNQFVLINFSQSQSTIQHSSGNYSTLEVKLFFKRQIGYFIVQTYLPCILIVILSQMSFWVNKKAVPARTVFGIMTILNLATLSISTRQQLPKVSYTTAMDMYIVTSFVFCFLSLIEFASVNYSETNRNRKVLEGPRTRRTKRSRNNDVMMVCALDKVDANRPELQKKILRLYICDAMVDVSLNDLMQIASSNQNGHRDVSNKSFLSRMMKTLYQFLAVDTTSTRPLFKGPLPERDVILARKLCNVAKEYIYDVLTSKDRVSPIDRNAKVLFPLLFGVFNILYWFIYFGRQKAVEDQMIGSI